MVGIVAQPQHTLALLLAVCFLIFLGHRTPSSFERQNLNKNSLQPSSHTCVAAKESITSTPDIFLECHMDCFRTKTVILFAPQLIEPVLFSSANLLHTSTNW